MLRTDTTLDQDSQTEELWMYVHSKSCNVKPWSTTSVKLNKISISLNTRKNWAFNFHFELKTRNCITAQLKIFKKSMQVFFQQNRTSHTELHAHHTHVDEGRSMDEIVFLQNATQSEFALNDRTARQACQEGTGPFLTQD